MAIFGVFDAFTGGGLIIGLVVAVIRRATHPAGAAAIWVSGSALALLALFNVAYFNGLGTDPVIGTPARAQVTGTWAGDHGATLALRPDGTFTASGLPPDAVVAPDVSPGTSQLSGHGTWSITPEDPSGSPGGVTFTFACGPGAGACGAFELEAETRSPSAGGGPALFCHLGDPGDWSDQYPLVRAP